MQTLVVAIEYPWPADTDRGFVFAQRTCACRGGQITDVARAERGSGAG